MHLTRVGISMSGANNALEPVSNHLRTVRLLCAPLIPPDTNNHLTHYTTPPNPPAIQPYFRSHNAAYPSLGNCKEYHNPNQQPNKFTKLTSSDYASSSLCNSVQLHPHARNYQFRRWCNVLRRANRRQLRWERGIERCNHKPNISPHPSAPLRRGQLI